MGNTVVIKASELAPVTLLEFARIIEQTGIPKGVINVITGLGEPCGKALTTHDLVERIAFTGGPDTAKHIVKNSSENLSQVSLELGGKSPVAVFDDADQENALNGITAGIFGASGQSCIAGSRLYLHEKIYDEFLNKLIEKAKKIKLGRPMEPDTQMGPLNSFKQLQTIEKNIKATKEQGGKIRCGGVHAKKAGEFGLMSILMLQSHITKIVTNQKNKEFISLLSKPIAGKKVVAVGTGSLGGSMIKHISKLDVEVIGVNRKGKMVEGCSKVITFDKIDEVLPDADFLYLAVPQTNETIGLINKKRLDMLKPSCGVVNIGRESVLDYKVLCEKLKNNQIAGAILDVFSQEPIDKNSELWNTPNLIITPHVSSDSEGNYVEMVLDIFFENLKLFLNNKKLNNLIDKNLGY